MSSTAGSTWCARNNWLLNFPLDCRSLLKHLATHLSFDLRKLCPFSLMDWPLTVSPAESSGEAVTWRAGSRGEEWAGGCFTSGRVSFRRVFIGGEWPRQPATNASLVTSRPVFPLSLDLSDVYIVCVFPSVSRKNSSSLLSVEMRDALVLLDPVTWRSKCTADAATDALCVLVVTVVSCCLWDLLSRFTWCSFCFSCKCKCTKVSLIKCFLLALESTCIRWLSLGASEWNGRLAVSLDAERTLSKLAGELVDRCRLCTLGEEESDVSWLDKEVEDDDEAGDKETTCDDGSEAAAADACSGDHFTRPPLIGWNLCPLALEVKLAMLIGWRWTWLGRA